VINGSGQLEYGPITTTFSVHFNPAVISAHIQRAQLYPKASTVLGHYAEL